MTSLQKLYVNRHGVFVSHMTTDMFITILSFPHSWFITGLVARVTRRVSCVEQELFTILQHQFAHVLLIFWVEFALFMLINSMFSSFYFSVMISATISKWKLPFLLFVGHVLFMLFVFIYAYWYSTRFPYQIMFVSLNSNMCSIFSCLCNALLIVVCPFLS